MGTFDAAANLDGTVIDTSSPPNPHFRVVAQHKTVRGGFHGQPVNPDVAADQAVFDAIGKVADHAAFQHDAVLDFRLADLGVPADRRERSDVGAQDPRTGTDDDGPADHRLLDDGARL